MKTKKIFLILDIVLYPFLAFWRLLTKRYIAPWHWESCGIKLDELVEISKDPEKSCAFLEVIKTSEKNTIFAEVPHDETIKSSPNALIRFLNLNFNWKNNVAILSAFNKDELAKKFFLGRVIKGQVSQIYSKPQRKQVAVIQGDQDQTYFAVDETGNFLHISVSRNAEKKYFQNESLRGVKLI